MNYTELVKKFVATDLLTSTLGAAELVASTGLGNGEDVLDEGIRHFSVHELAAQATGVGVHHYAAAFLVRLRRVGPLRRGQARVQVFHVAHRLRICRGNGGHNHHHHHHHHP